MVKSPRWWRSWRVLVSNIAMFVAIVAAFAIVSRLVRNPELIDTDLPIALSADLLTAGLGDEIVFGDLALRVERFAWIDSSDFGDEDRLSARADPRRGRDYLVVDLTIANRGAASVDARYQGQGAPLDLRATARRPQPILFSSVVPGDAATITGREPLPNGSLAAGGEIRGALVFALEPSRRQLGLLLMTSETGATPVEVTLSDDR
jgi:hypothetical protein